MPEEPAVAADVPTAPVIAPPPTVPIEVNEKPWQEQLQAGLRVILGSLALIFATLVGAGYLWAKDWIAYINLALGVIGPAVAIISAVIGIVIMVWGNLKTLKLAKTNKALTDFLPDRYAKFK